MTRFSKMELKDGKLVEVPGSVREIPQSAMLRCPHTIMMPEHYRRDHSCRCDDPAHEEMAEWGYTWDDDEGVWE